MSYLQVQATLSARLSRHNDERDDRHLQLWQELLDRILLLTQDPRYADIEPGID